MSLRRVYRTPGPHPRETTPKAVAAWFENRGPKPSTSALRKVANGDSTYSRDAANYLAWQKPSFLKTVSRKLKAMRKSRKRRKAKHKRTR